MGETKIWRHAASEVEAYGEKGDAVQESSAGTDCHKLFVIELTSPCFLGCCVRYFCSFWFDKIKSERERKILFCLAEGLSMQ